MAKNRTLITSAEAGALVGGGPVLRELLRTGRLNGCRPFGGTTIRSMMFRPEDVLAAQSVAETERAATIYVVGFDQYVKIGFSLDAKKRFLSLQDRLPVDLELYAQFPGTTSDERALHARFDNLRLRGEWFRKRGKLLRWINDGCPKEADNAA